jgi:hypothetical protein
MGLLQLQKRKKQEAPICGYCEKKLNENGEEE